MNDVVQSKRSESCKQNECSRMQPASIPKHTATIANASDRSEQSSTQNATAMATADKENHSEPMLIVASMGTEDRLGDIIDPAGWDLESYRRNPVFLWAHQRADIPIGRSVKTWVQGNLLLAAIDFAPTALAQTIRNLYQSGHMRGISVGFRPIEFVQRTASNGRKAVRFIRQELLEISAAPVPMHPDALARTEDGATNQRKADIAPDARSQLAELTHMVSRLKRDATALY